VARVAEQGFDLGHVAKDVLGHLRNLVVAKVCAVQSRDSASVRELLELADEELGVVMALAEQAELDDLTRCFQGFSRSFDDIVKSGQPRMALEMTLVRLARRPPLLPLDELLSRVGELEKRLGGTPPSGPLPRGSGGPARGGTSTVGSAQTSPEPPARTRGSLALAQGEPRAGASAGPRPSERPLDVPRPVLVPVPSPSVAVDARAWYGLVERLRSTHPALASIFEHALPIEVGPERVVLTFETTTFVAERANEPETLRVLTEIARRHFDAQTSVIIDTSAKAASGVRTVAHIEAERREAELAKARATVQEHPLVREAVRVFGAQVRDVKLPSGDG
jgi:DNA polymerase-3 subunit gamma/tau